MTSPGVSPSRPGGRASTRYRTTLSTALSLWALIPFLSALATLWFPVQSWLRENPIVMGAGVGIWLASLLTLGLLLWKKAKRDRRTMTIDIAGLLCTVTIGVGGILLAVAAAWKYPEDWPHVWGVGTPVVNVELESPSPDKHVFVLDVSSSYVKEETCGRIVRFLKALTSRDFAGTPLISPMFGEHDAFQLWVFDRGATPVLQSDGTAWGAAEFRTLIEECPEDHRRFRTWLRTRGVNSDTTVTNAVTCLESVGHVIREDSSSYDRINLILLSDLIQDRGTRDSKDETSWVTECQNLDGLDNLWTLVVFLEDPRADGSREDDDKIDLLRPLEDTMFQSTVLVLDTEDFAAKATDLMLALQRRHRTEPLFLGYEPGPRWRTEDARLEFTGAVTPHVAVAGTESNTWSIQLSTAKVDGNLWRSRYWPFDGPGEFVELPSVESLTVRALGESGERSSRGTLRLALPTARRVIDVPIVVAPLPPTDARWLLRGLVLGVIAVIMGPVALLMYRNAVTDGAVDAVRELEKRVEDQTEEQRRWSREVVDVVEAVREDVVALRRDAEVQKDGARTSVEPEDSDTGSSQPLVAPMKNIIRNPGVSEGEAEPES